MFGKEIRVDTGMSYRRVKEWRRKNRERYNRFMREYRSRAMPSRDKFFADLEEVWFRKNARTRFLLKQATPSWATRHGIRRVYEECFRMEEKMNMTLVVAHAIPIRHKHVCGLHVGVNLKVMSLRYHRTAGRRFRKELREKAEHEQMEWLRKHGLSSSLT